MFLIYDYFDLFSFPTRRSSDLLFMTPLLDQDSEITVLDDLKSKVVVGQTLEVLEQAGIQIEASHDLMHYRVPGRDRKSTRLNSSHVKISYAVFCLKKKRRKN